MGAEAQRPGIGAVVHGEDDRAEPGADAADHGVLAGRGEDIALLAGVAEVHETMSGPACRRRRKREPFGGREGARGGAALWPF